MNDMERKPDPAPDTVETEVVANFAAHCAHDFNNLLTGILGNLELMQNRAKRQGVTHFDGYLDGARNAAGRAAAFAQRLLAFSGRAAGDPVPVLVDRVTLDLVDLVHEQGITILTDLAAGTAIAVCDPAQLELALQELFANAAEATKAGGTITLHTSLKNPGTVDIAVVDTGAGMAPLAAARALEPFFTTRPNGAGKGLGLPIAAHFARQAGGAIAIESAPGAGTTVTISLPLSLPLRP